MKALKEMLAHATANKALRVPVYVETLTKAIKEHDDALGMLTAFRHAANSLALEAGVIPAHVAHNETVKSVLQDVYFLQQLAEVELRFRTVSTGYERLRAAALGVVDHVDEHGRGDGADLSGKHALGRDNRRSRALGLEQRDVRRIHDFGWYGGEPCIVPSD